MVRNEYRRKKVLRVMPNAMGPTWPRRMAGLDVTKSFYDGQNGMQEYGFLKSSFASR